MAVKKRLWRLLIETAVLHKSENIQPNLAGEWMRAILNDTPYPLTLLSTLVMRIRADRNVNPLRVATLKSILIKNFGMTKEAPVSLDPDNKEPGYLLGRLFATYEQIQTAALGRNVNATIKDKFYGAASSQPRKVFPLLAKGSQPHLAKIGKERRGYQITLDREVAEIMEAMSPDADPFPSHLPDRQQGLFALGYYHQRNKFFAKADKAEDDTNVNKEAAA
jgi:CRISPR-associated protein Csd1